MDPITVLIDAIDLSIEPWIMALAATQMLPMRRRGLFLAIELAGAPNLGVCLRCGAFMVLGRSFGVRHP